VSSEAEGEKGGKRGEIPTLAWCLRAFIGLVKELKKERREWQQMKRRRERSEDERSRCMCGPMNE